MNIKHLGAYPEVAAIGNFQLSTEIRYVISRSRYPGYLTRLIQPTPKSRRVKKEAYGLIEISELPGTGFTFDPEAVISFEIK